MPSTSIPFNVELFESLTTSLVDSDAASPDRCRAKLIVNAPNLGLKVFSALEEELKNTDREFLLSAAFITLAGVRPFLNTLAELEKRGIPGRVLTTDYKLFTDPAAINRLLQFKNIEVRMHHSGLSSGFHAKAYIFSSRRFESIILGSSNLTQSALFSNIEWNIQLASSAKGELSRRMRREFEMLWRTASDLSNPDVFSAYEKRHRLARPIRPEEAAAGQLVREANERIAEEVKPNPMQERFISALKNSKEEKALLISATGTGKTMAAALAMKELDARRLLFLVHREAIAAKAMSEFSRVFGKSRSYSLASGNSKANPKADFIFATVQTAAGEDFLETFPPEAFSHVVIDESHHAAAPTYRRIMKRFKPELMLGMTATPDRADAQNVYELFGRNIAAEIRLQEALAQDLLSPFHYFGVDGGSCIPLEGRYDQTAKLVKEKSEFYGYSGDRLRGLIFCSRVADCVELARELELLGFRAKALSGASSESEREAAVLRLEADASRSDALDFILSVDVFAEGIDIPKVNQVIFLRPTESPIVFIQQLGRGLRKAPGKEHLVVIDFIGNHKQNFLIPTALSGDNSYSRDRLRRFMLAGKNYLPGATTIHFEAVAEERIFRSIAGKSMESLRILKDGYFELKARKGEVPKLVDFDLMNSIDPALFFNGSSSYYDFIAKHDPNALDSKFNERQRMMLAHLGRFIIKAVRPSEALVIKDVLAGKTLLKESLAERLASDYGFEASELHLANVFQVLSARFYRTASEEEKWREASIVEPAADEFVPSKAFLQELQCEEFKSFISDMADFVLARWSANIAPCYKNTFMKLNASYSREQISLLLDWPKNYNGGMVGGYLHEKTTNTFPVFITYDKTASEFDYEDRFESPSILIAKSKDGAKADGAAADVIFRRNETASATRIYLFVRKDIDDEYFFLGEINSLGGPVEIPGRRGFEVRYELDVPVDAKIYDYLCRSDRALK